MIELNLHTAPVGAADVGEAVAELAAALRNHPSYESLRAAHQALQADSEAQSLLQDLQARQRHLQFSGNGTDDAEFQERLQRFYSHPTVATYHEAEESLVDLLKEVDSSIGAAAGIDFAANAKRSCCGG